MERGQSVNEVLGDSILLTYYPEGGSIMPGEISIVGLGSTDGHGMPVSIEGEIKDNRDSVITKFSTNKAGLGKFELNASGFRMQRSDDSDVTEYRTFFQKSTGSARTANLVVRY